MTWAFGNYPDALQDYCAAVRALVASTPASPRSLCLLLGYPLAYAIALKAGRWKNLMLVW